MDNTSEEDGLTERLGYIVVTLYSFIIITMKYCLIFWVSTADPAGRLSPCGHTRHNLQNPRRRDCREIIALRI